MGAGGDVLEWPAEDGEPFLWQKFSRMEIDGTSRHTIGIDYMICDCSYQNRKRLIISFGLNQSMEDFLIHFETVEGYYHLGLYERAKRIPIKYFIQKVIYENYDLILTGDSLGASIAGIVTANILTHKAMSNQKDKRNQVLFVGFGSPAFGSRDFKKFVDNFV